MCSVIISTTAQAVTCGRVNPQRDRRTCSGWGRARHRERCVQRNREARAWPSHYSGEIAV